MNKFDSRWDTGVWLGIRDESGESVIGTSAGVIKTRSFRRKAIMAERWDKNVITSVVGVPWRPVPGRGGDDIRIDVNIPEPREVIPPIPRQPESEPVRRRTRINRSDAMKHGFTVGCDGCRTVRLGLKEHRGHSEKCRAYRRKVKRRKQRKTQKSG